MTRNEIVLIGAIGIGKSTVARLIADRLGVGGVSMDDVCYDYYAEAGYDPTAAQRALDREGPLGWQRHMEPFAVSAVERLLAEYANCVIDFGAGHSVIENSTLFARLSAALASYPNVFLIQPSADVEQSLALLSTRKDADWMRKVHDLNRHFLSHASNQRLAKHILFTEGQTPAQVAGAVMALVVGWGKLTRNGLFGGGGSEDERALE